MALYEDLFDKKLRVSGAFLEGNANVIRERLKRAADAFKRDHAHMIAIGMCLHTASSIILSNADNLKGTLKDIDEVDELKGKDPTFVLTVSVLCYLVNNRWDPGQAQSEGFYKELRSGFDAMNWLVGPDAVRVLGLSATDKGR